MMYSCEWAIIHHVDKVGGWFDSNATIYRHHSHALEDAACNDDQDPMIIASMIIGNEVNNAMAIVKYEHFTIMLIVRWLCERWFVLH